MSGRRRIRENDIDALAFPVTRARSGEQQAEARDVDALADFFERFRAIHAANVNLRGNFGALAPAALDAVLRAGGNALRIWLCLCGGDRRCADCVASSSAGCVRPPRTALQCPPLLIAFLY